MKNLMIASVVGLLFMAGGFWYGLRLKPLPTPASTEALAAALTKSAAPDAPPPISVATLTKASESMMSLNEALKAREEKVAAREEAVKEREDELAAERTALDSSHEKFKALFEEFQQRLQLVEANQVEQLEKEAELYEGMNIDQAIDLIRVKDDGAITKLFSVMETKPLGKLVGQWKVKYPQDGARVVAVLDGLGEVMPKEKIALSDTTAPTDASPAAPATDASSPAPSADASAPTPVAPATDSTTPAAPEPDPTTQPPDNSSPAAAPAPAPTSPTDPTATPPTDPTSPANTNSTAPLAPPPDSTQPAAPATAPAATTASN
jgi:hypothetical protein